MGDFDGNGQHDLLAYVRMRMNWWLGTAPSGQLSLRDLGSTSGFGQIGDGRPFWTGRFSRSDRDEILFYFPGDDNWWLGSHDGQVLQWSFAGNTKIFGHAINDGRPFWIGDFTGGGRSQVLFYFPGDKNWWLGQHNGSALAWSLLGNTLGFGQIWDRRPFRTGRFAQRDRDNVVFYFPGDGKYWIATDKGGQFEWRMFGDF